MPQKNQTSGTGVGGVWRIILVATIQNHISSTEAKMILWKRGDRFSQPQAQQRVCWTLPPLRCRRPRSSSIEGYWGKPSNAKTPTLASSSGWGKSRGREWERFLKKKKKKSSAKIGERKYMTQRGLKCNVIFPLPPSIPQADAVEWKLNCRPASRGISVSCHHRIVCTGGRIRDPTQQTRTLASLWAREQLKNKTQKAQLKNQIIHKCQIYH